MEDKKNSMITSLSANQEDVLKNEMEKLIPTLPSHRGWGYRKFCQYKGYWASPISLKGLISTYHYFQAQQSDIILASLPKSGTTWLKALIFSIINRSRYKPKNSPLLTNHTHDLVPFLDNGLFLSGMPQNLDQLSQPRIFATHLHYPLLPSSIKDSKCRIVYVCRNPFDNFISLWHFTKLIRREDAEVASLGEAFESYCEGVHIGGPFWDSILGYWKMSLEEPEKVMLLKYEDLKEDVAFQMKKLAKFLGFPFSDQEEKEGLIEEIEKLCSLETLKSLEVNQSSRRYTKLGARTDSFFRKGEVGDYINHLTPSMIKKLEKVIQEKFAGSGLVLSTSLAKNN